MTILLTQKGGGIEVSQYGTYSYCDASYSMRRFRRCQLVNWDRDIDSTVGCFE